MILGLDISTSCTGWAIISDDGVPVEMGTIVLSKEKCLYSKAEKIKIALVEIMAKHSIDKIYVEENLQAFRSGFSSAKTISTLAKFNGITCYVAHETFGLKPTNINVNVARKTLGISIIPKRKGGDTKEQVLSWTKEQLSSLDSFFDWPTKTLKSGPRKGQTIQDPTCYDIADAYVVALAGSKLNI